MVVERLVHSLGQFTREHGLYMLVNLDRLAPIRARRCKVVAVRLHRGLEAIGFQAQHDLADTLFVHGHSSRVKRQCLPGAAVPGFRSEEHTSELQSLMRISYAVFCLKTNTPTLS